MTAEFVVALPAVCVVLAACLCCVQAATLQARLTDAAGQTARAMARGEAPEPVIGGLSATVRGLAVDVERSGGGVCVRLSVPAAPLPLLDGLRVGGRACALES